MNACRFCSRFLCSLGMFVIMAAEPVMGQPVIDRVEGTVAAGAALSILGSGFGTKSPAAPIAWLGGDQTGPIESGVDGAIFSTAICANAGPTVSAAKAHSGNKSVKHTLASSSWLNCNVGPQARVYFTGWAYIDRPTDNTAWKAQWKPFRLTSGSVYAITNENSTINDNWFCGGTSKDTLYWGCNTSRQLQAYLSGGTYRWTGNWASDSVKTGEWQRIEAYYSRNSAANANNGTLWQRRLGTSSEYIVNSSAVTTHDTAPGVKDWSHFIVGLYYGNQKNEDGTEYTGPRGFDVYWDDHYLDNTQARVELCVAGTWSARSHCEIQPPTAWDNQQIAFNLNLGSLGACRWAYLFVVDEAGEVNNAGKAIYITGAACPGPPSGLQTPTGLRAN